MNDLISGRTNSTRQSELHTGHRDRVREKIIAAGVEVLAPHEILEYLLFYCIPRKDTNELAHALIERFGSFAGVLEADYSELEKVNGISRMTAVFLSSIPGIAQSYLKDRWREKPIIKDSVTLGHYLVDLFSGEKNEAFYVMCLDSQCRLIKTELVYRGTINETPIFPRLVGEFVIKNNAAAVVFSHNHPGGSLTASNKDLETTKTLVDLMTTFSIRALDHIIVCGDRFVSLKNRGQMAVQPKFNLRETDGDNINGDWYFG